MTPATALLATLALSAGADLQTLSGKHYSGELVGIDRQNVVVRTTAGDTVHVKTADVLQLTMPPVDPPPRGAHTAVELTDGSTLLCSAVAVNGNSAELTMIPGTKVTLPVTAIFTILRDAHDPKIRAEWQDFLGKRGRLDMVVVRAEDKLNGLEGTFGAGNGDAIEFTANGSDQKRTVRLVRAQGLIFVQKPDPAAPSPMCRVSDTVGNLLVAADVVLNADGLTVTTVAGARVGFPDPKRLAKLDFSKGKLAYLSDLAPSRETVILATEDDDQYARFVRYRKDKNLDNQPIKLAGKQHDKGITLHAGTQLVYPIGGDYKEFRATLGVDETVETESRVEVIVEGDGRELFRGQTSRKEPPTPIVVDVHSVRDLRISVRSTGLLDFGDQVSLADAKVSK
ncbi:MAG TPA: NPCBM/NEW2 domain-containing protein [Gemmataceae bacterium]|nr:NPCBM/NEW2 domain-containing protein [Gemmataceae bacterium]